jgi:O-antigen/teichoic acid export membrane protein
MGTLAEKEAGTAAAAERAVGTGAVLMRFFALLSARGLRDGLVALFLLYLAWLDVDAFGRFMLAVAAGTVVLKIVDCGFNDLLIRRLAAQDRLDLAQVLSVNLLKLALLALTLAGLWLFGRALGYPAEAHRTVFLVALGMGLGSLVDSLYRVLRIQGRQLAESLFRVGTAAAGVGLSVLAMQLGAGAQAAGFVFAIESALGLFSVLFFLEASRELPRLWRRVSPRGLAGLLRDAAPFALISVNAIVYNKSNVIFLERYAGARAVAAYSASWMIVDWVSVAASAYLLGGVLYPLLAERHQRDDRRMRLLAGQAWTWLLAIAWPICLVLYGFRQPIIHLVFGDAYAQAAELQALLVLTVPAAFSTNVMLYLLYAAGRPWLFFALSLVTQAASLGLNLWLVPAGGARGAALVIVGSKALMAVLTLLCGIAVFATPRPRQIAAVSVLGAALWGGFALGRRFLPPEAATVVLVGFYAFVLTRLRPRLADERSPRLAGAARREMAVP